jgi:hypothetical protein
MMRNDLQSTQSDKLIAAIKSHAEKIQEYYAALKTLAEIDQSVILPELSELVKFEGLKVPNLPDSSIRPDEFHNKAIPLAAEMFLKKIGHAVSIDDIYDALEQGGIEFTTNGKTVLSNAIRRDPEKFEKIKNGHIGLREWYGKKKGQAQRVINLLEEAMASEKEKTEEKE